MNEQHVGKKVLVTVDNWFYAPNGKSYRAVWGTLKAVKTAEDTLGVRPNGRSTNWYLEVGNLTIAGCQVHYVLQTDTVEFGEVDEFSTHEGLHVVSKRPSAIYNANDGPATDKGAKYAMNFTPPTEPFPETS